ncbi:MAG TPA: hypothetical protein VLF93_02295 [Candidatus Saccharimonadales bacterium]|nr:hypothetical protein [Candidatus Saccharimonadales bacterium]
MTKKPLKLRSLFKTSLVFSFAGLSFFIIPTLIHSQAHAAAGAAYVVTTQRDSNNALVNTLSSMDLTTGASTQIGNPLESVLPGNNSVATLASYDPAGHRYMYASGQSGIEYIVIQNTQTGAITTVTNPILNGLNNMAYDTSTNTLYVATTQRDSNNALVNTLSSIDLTTGAATQIGDPLESVLPGNNSVATLASYDPAGHRYMYWAGQSGTGYIVIQNTQTGAITTVTDPILNDADNMAYDTSTNTLYVVTTQSGGNNTLSNTLNSIDLTTGAATQIGDPLESVLPGDNFVAKLASYDPAGHRYMYVDGQPGIEYIVIQNTQTGAITTVTDPILNGVDNMAFALPPPPQLTSLAPANLWMSHGTLDAGIKLDVQAQAYVNNNLVSSGEIDSVSVGSNVGPGGITEQTIPFNSFTPVDFPSGSSLSIKVSARNACIGSGKNSGTAKLWYNTSSKNSNFGATVNTLSNTYYLLDNSTLGTAAGAGPLKSSTIQAGVQCSPFQSFGTWAITP